MTSVYLLAYMYERFIQVFQNEQTFVEFNELD